MKRKLASLFLVLCMLIGAGIVAPAAADKPTFDNMEDLMLYIYDNAYMLADGIEFYYTEALDSTLIYGDDDVLWDMQNNCGIEGSWLQHSKNTRSVKMRNIEYMPGFRIAQAWEIELTDMLSSEEMTVLAIAQAIVDDARQNSQSDFELLKNLHDSLIRHVTYTSGNDSDDMDYVDSAIGALIYGQAECDGYADAFYLLCTLADIPAGYQHGEVDTGGAHLWNVVWVNGIEYYQVDVTWDDYDWDDAIDMCSYRYFVVGSSMMEDHFWDPELSPVSQAKYNDWDSFYYTADNSGRKYGAYYETLRDAAEYIAYMQREYGARRIYVMVDGYYADATELNSILKDSCRMDGHWWSWAQQMGKYTCFDVLVEDS